ncbi:hypothetical protein F4811DRAFT_167159 [Daldinia bambusicola]|nr:hypothetical protein F4811DRAFT_167159 [Daldinia bambusicola]
MKSLLTQLRHTGSARTSSSSSREMKLDIISRLPFEIHVLIITYLEPKDIDAGLSACRHWRGVWLSDEIWPKLARRWFPGLEDHIRNSATPGQDLGEIFRNVLHKIQRRVSGRFASALHHKMCLGSDRFFTLSKDVPEHAGGVHCYDDVDDLELDDGTYFPRFMMYNNGRIAWWPEAYVLPYFAVVDDLRTRKRRAYIFPNHRGEKQGFKTAMSGKLLLMGRGRTLHAWHLELDRLHSTRVPEEFVRCIAEGETVLIVTKNAELFIWKFDREPEHIDVTGCYIKGPLGTSHIYDFTPGQLVSSHNAGSRLVQNGMLLDFIISPTEDNVFFVITLTPTPKKQLRVHEIRNGVLAETYSLDKTTCPDTTMEPLEFTNLRWEKVDSYGGYCLMQAIFPANHNLNLAAQETACYPLGDSLISVCFNIYTKSFTVPHYHHSSHRSACQIWNDRIAATNADNALGPILSLPPCGGAAHPCDKSRLPPIYTTVPTGRGDLCRRRRVSSEKHSFESTGADFALDSNPQYDRTTVENTNVASPLVPGVKRLVGDDDFLVLIIRQSYTVWSFGNEISEKISERGRKSWRNLIR